MGNGNSEPEPDVEKKPKDLGVWFLGAILLIASYMAGITTKGCNNPGPGPGPGPDPIMVDAEEAASKAISNYAKALSTICLEVASSQDQGQITKKAEIIQFMNDRFAEERPTAFRPIGELLDVDYSANQFRKLSKGFGKHAD